MAKWDLNYLEIPRFIGILAPFRVLKAAERGSYGSCLAVDTAHTSPLLEGFNAILPLQLNCES